VTRASASLKKTSFWLPYTCACSTLLAISCGDNKTSNTIGVNGAEPSTGGAATAAGGAATNTSGAASSTIGARTSTGGWASGTDGTNSFATGGAITGTGGATTTANAYWPAAYNPAGAPAPEDGFHTEAVDACLSCHGISGNANLKIVFGGKLYESDGTTPAANVQVGVVDGNNKYFGYSATNGLYWVEGTATVSWATADIRIRDAKGETLKLSNQPRSADCDSCHTGTLILKAI